MNRLYRLPALAAPVRRDRLNTAPADSHSAAMRYPLRFHAVLKIGNVNWKGRCAVHPRYDPRVDGEAGIRGGCRRCYALLGIYERHRDLIAAVREFGSSAIERRRAEPDFASRQRGLFDS